MYANIQPGHDSKPSEQLQLDVEEHFAPSISQYYQYYQYLTPFWHDAKSDFKRTRWLRLGGWLLIFLWILALPAALITSSFIATHSLDEYGSSNMSPCIAGSSFSLHLGGYSAWAFTGFFDVTLGFGKLSFTAAKAIDVVWDVVLGRMGQGVLVYFAWKSFTSYVTVTMETVPITYDTFWTTFMHKEPHWTSLYRLLREPFLRRGLASKLALLFMILSIAFMTAFPTFTSAMTGYQQNVEAYVQDVDENFISFRKFSPVLWVIHDGDRVNLTKDYPVILENTGECQPTFDIDPYMGVCFRYCYQDRRAGCELVHDTWIYMVDSNKTTFQGHDNLDPPLNISTNYFTNSLRFATSSSDRDSEIRYPKSLAKWVASNKTSTVYNVSWIEAHGQCEPSGTYRWGFSYIQLCIMLLLLLIWTLGTYALWLKAHLTQYERGHTRIAGELKAAIQLVDAIHKEFSKEDLNELSESQLRHCIRKELNGGHVSYAAPAAGLEGRFSLRRGLWRWVKREKWWALAIVVVALVPSTVWMKDYHAALVWGIFMLAGVVFALVIGTTHRSRALIIFVVWVIGAVVTISLRYGRWTVRGVCDRNDNGYDNGYEWRCQ